MDALSHRTLEAHALLVALSPATGAAPFEFIFKVLGIKPASTEGREITERLALYWRIQREHTEQARQKHTSNGHTTRS